MRTNRQEPRKCCGGRHALLILHMALCVLCRTASAQSHARSAAETVFGMDAEAERKITQEITACEKEKRWHEMAALCYDAIGRTQKQFYYDRLLVAIENQKRPSELADAIFSYMLRFPTSREAKYAPWADAMREAGRTDEAELQFQQWTESMPAEVAAWSALAGLLVGAQRPADAQDTLIRALAAVKDDTAKQELRIALARVYIQRSDPDRAIATYDEVISAAPAIPGFSQKETVSELARFLAATNRLDRYVAILESRLGDPAKDKYTLETILGVIDTRTHPKALAFQRRLTDLDPSRAAYLTLREVAERRNAAADEIAILETMFRQFPETRGAWRQRLLDLYVATGDSLKAVPMLEDMLREQTNAITYARAATAALGFGDRGLASKWIDEARRFAPDPGASATIARALIRMDRHAEALAVAMAMAPTHDSLRLRNEVMAELEKTGKRDLVIKALTDAATAQPTNAAPWIDLARYHARNNDTTSAAAAWKRVVDIEPSQDAYRNWIAALRLMSDSAPLLPAMERSFKAYPSIDTGKALAPLLVKAGRTTDAMKVHAQTIAMTRTPAEKAQTHVALIRVLLAERQNTEAKGLIDEAMLMDPPAALKDELEKSRGLLEANERHEEFVRKAMDKADKNPRDPAAQRSAAQALRITGHPLRAADYYRRALAIEDQTSTRWDLAYVLTSGKQYADAIKTYQDLLKRDLTAQERDSAIKAVAESYDALGETANTLKFLVSCVDDIRTPYIRNWAQSRIQALRAQPQ